MDSSTSSDECSETSTPAYVPRLYKSKFFGIKSRIGNSITLECKKCLKTIKGDMRSSGNFVSHYSVNILLY